MSIRHPVAGAVAWPGLEEDSMSRYRARLPQLGGGLFLTDGGIETTLVFHDGLDLPEFASFVLLRDSKGRAALRRYFASYAEIARRFEAGLILETATWRASAAWGRRLSYSVNELFEANREAVRMLEEIRSEFENEQTPVVISGCAGPRGDGYIPKDTMTPAEAEGYHREQVETFQATAADLVTAITMNYAEEAIGFARAAQNAGMPAVISFTVETDGNLPTGQPLREAIQQVDSATSSYPSYYMLNCAHPSHFEHIFAEAAPEYQRIQGLRANASAKSHAELNDSTELDAGDPVALGDRYARLKRSSLPYLNVVGGCCGTDTRHIGQIAQACAPLFQIAV
jgi:homocysteine S-methyltransferase